ncbi:MAG TPA: hypothetical protein VH518_07245 [Tepidisphaeraceae bacterium]|jgi:formate/nitrite transporter FocA (FNT family)
MPSRAAPTRRFEGQFSHVIADSVKAFYLAASGTASWLKAIELFIVPALIGNILGGAALVAALNDAKAATSKGEPTSQ